MEKVRSGYCPYCKKKVALSKKGVNHTLHLLLSIFTGGIWIIPWILISANNAGNYRCSQCGEKLTPMN